VLEHVVEAEDHVVRRADPFGRVDHAALCGRNDLAARHGHRIDAHFLEDLAGQPGGERYFIFFMSAIELIGVLNQPKGSGPIGCIMKGLMFIFRPCS
jgi:hypothetical protein